MIALLIAYAVLVALALAWNAYNFHRGIDGAAAVFAARALMLLFGPAAWLTVLAAGIYNWRNGNPWWS